MFLYRQAGVWGGFVSLAHLAYQIASLEKQGIQREFSLLPVRFKPATLKVEIEGRHTVQLPFNSTLRPLGDYEPLMEVKPYRLDALPDELKDALRWLSERFRANRVVRE